MTIKRIGGYELTVRRVGDDCVLRVEYELADSGKGGWFKCFANVGDIAAPLYDMLAVQYIGKGEHSHLFQQVYEFAKEAMEV